MKLAYRWLISILIFIIICSGSGFSEDQTFVPDDLSPWVNWVKQRNPNWQCANVEGAMLCAWPGKFEYKLNERNGIFKLFVEVLDTSDVQLPSSSALYPFNIEIKDSDEKAIKATLQRKSNQLFVKLPKGTFTITGEFQWDKIPTELPLPSLYGLFELTHNGHNVNFRRGEQSVWIEDKEAGKEAEQLTISVFRKIIDTSPMQIDTLIRLRVSGTNRALNLGKVILPGTTPVKSESALPHYLSNDGSLGLQLIPGQHELLVTSIASQPISSLQTPALALPEWPKEEIWSFVANEAFRSVNVSGASPVQASLTQLPEDWHAGATFVVQGADTVTFNLLRRGEHTLAANSINLEREIWTDLDGSGFTVRDSFNGTMNNNFRLNSLPETILGRATINGLPALVTVDPVSQQNGIELRTQQLSLETVSRLNNTRSFSAVGWDTTVENLSLRMHLPPSWKLFHVSGAYAEDSTWIQTWSLLDIFMALLIVIGSFKLFGPTIAVAVAALLVLGHNEFVAPRIFFIYTLIFFVWTKLAQGRGRGWEIASQLCLAATFAALALQSLSFAKLQFIQMLFPQLQSGTRYKTLIQIMLDAIETSLFIWPFLLLLAVILFFAVRALKASKGFLSFIGRAALFGGLFIVACSVLGPLSFKAGYLPGAAPAFQSSYDEIDLAYSERSLKSKQFESVANTAPLEQFSYESKNLLSGPAVPSWQWRTHTLYVPGPVNSNYKVDFYLLPPWLTRMLCGIRVMASLLLLSLLAKALGYTAFLRPTMERSKNVAALLIFFLMVAPQSAQAEFPSDAILQELQNRLEKGLCKSKTCALIENLRIDISGVDFTIEARVSSEGRATVTLPGPLEVMLPNTISRNDSSTMSFFRTKEGYLSLLTEDGRNTFRIKGVLPLESSFSLQFQSRPVHLEVNTPDWFVEGLSSSGYVRESLRFTRKSLEADSSESLTTDFNERTTAADLPSWFVVKRNYMISEDIRADLEVERLGALGKATQVKIPLLPGERITSGAATIENGFLLVRFSANESKVNFSGELPFTGNLELTAANLPNVSERWMVRCSSMIRCLNLGLTPTHSVYNSEKASLWLPFPNEKESVEYKDLEGLEGDFLPIDSTEHNLNWGAQLLKGSLTIELRATEQTPFEVLVPELANITGLRVNGVSGGGTVKDQKGLVLLSPGEHQVTLSYSIPWTPSWIEHAPLIKLSANAHNLNVNVFPSEDRWLLWTGGISWGPCVLFWGKLFFIILLCLALTKAGLMPLGTFGAIMLGIGLTSIPIIWMFIPLAWLISLKLIPLLHEKWIMLAKPIRLIMFVGLSLLALVFFFKIVQFGLVLDPPMLVAGNQSNASHLKWFVDHTGSSLAQPWIVSLPLWSWRIFALLWSTWLILALFSWLKLAVDIEGPGQRKATSENPLE